jgi:hypothetical protein
MRMRSGCAGVLLFVAVVSTAAVAEESAAPAEAASSPVSAPANATSDHRWHMPRRNARQIPRDATESHPDDWNPLAKPAGIAKTFLRDHRVTTDLFLMFFNQYASEVREGQHNYATFAWRSMGDVELVKDSRIGASYLEWDMNGTAGFNYDQGLESLSTNAGIISSANANVFPHTSAMDELFWKQVSPAGSLIVLAGQIDQSFHFDTNRVANNDMQQMLSFALMNNLSIPWPLYGGLGGLVRWNASEQISLMLGAGDSSSNQPWGFWQSVDDGSWYGLLEIDHK